MHKQNQTYNASISRRNAVYTSKRYISNNLDQPVKPKKVEMKRLTHTKLIPAKPQYCLYENSVLTSFGENAFFLKLSSFLLT